MPPVLRPVSGCERLNPVLGRILAAAMHAAMAHNTTIAPYVRSQSRWLQLNSHRGRGVQGVAGETSRVEIEEPGSAQSTEPVTMKKLSPLFAATSALTALAATPALAAPIYLSCTVSREGGGNTPTTKIEFTLNEEAQTGSYYIPETGYTKRLGATFQRDVITMREVSINAVGSTDGSTFSLDRTNGQIVRSISLLGGQMTMRDTGKCIKSAPPATRAF
jgi:hypothetical protein